MAATADKAWHPACALPTGARLLIPGRAQGSIGRIRCVIDFSMNRRLLLEPMSHNEAANQLGEPVPLRVVGIGYSRLADFRRGALIGFRCVKSHVCGTPFIPISVSRR